MAIEDNKTNKIHPMSFLQLLVFKTQLFQK